MRPAVSDGEVFWVNEGSATLGGLMREAFPHRSESERASKASRVQRLNPHIRDWNVLHPGQLVALGLPEETGGFRSCHAFDTDLHQLQLEFGAFTGEERKELMERWDFWNALWEVVSNPTFVPSAILASEFKSEMQKALEFKKKGLVPPYILQRIERIVEKMFVEVIVQAKGLSTQITTRVTYSVTRHSYFILTRDNAGFAAYTSKLRKIKLLMGLLKAAPRIIVGVDMGRAFFRVVGAENGWAMAKEIGKSSIDIGSGLIVGRAGSLAGVAVCSLVFGIPSGGLALPACSLVGVVGASAASTMVNDAVWKALP